MQIALGLHLVVGSKPAGPDGPPPPPTDPRVLREDGSVMLREDGTAMLRES